MLKRKYRLGAKVKIKPAHSFSTHYFILKTSENNLTYNRFRFVVSKKISKSAVARNKIKRKLSKCIENMFLQIKPGYDLIFFAKKDILSLTLAQIEIVVKEALKKRDLLI